MGKKANAVNQKVNWDKLMNKGQPMPKMELTEAEKINFTILLEKANQLQVDFQKVNIAIAGLVGQIVQSRGLDTTKFGVNLAAGRILPIETPVVAKSPGGDGVKMEA